MPAFGGSAPTFGGSAPAFGASTSAPLFGAATSTPAFGQGTGAVSGTPAFGLGNGPASGAPFAFGSSQVRISQPSWSLCTHVPLDSWLYTPPGTEACKF